jgi:ribosomal protein S18 acetylase RimI-like enzyme
MDTPVWKTVPVDPVQTLVRLVPVDKDNWRECARLPTGPDHKYVTSNVYSIAEAQFQPESRSCCVYHSDEMVGYSLFFLFYGDDLSQGLWVTRLMIAETQRGKGYGRATLQQLLSMARQQGCVEVALDTHPDNFKAIALYESLGFRPIRMVNDTERVYSCPIPA